MPTCDFDLRKSVFRRFKYRVSQQALSKLATIDKDLVIGKLGSLLQGELTAVDKNLVKIFKLGQ